MEEAQPKKRGRPPYKNRPKPDNENIFEMLDQEREANTDMTPYADSKPSPALPKAIVLTRPHGYIDDEGKLRYWQQHQVVDDPEHVDLLIKRGADFKEK